MILNRCEMECDGIKPNFNIKTLLWLFEVAEHFKMVIKESPKIDEAENKSSFSIFLTSVLEA